MILFISVFPLRHSPSTLTQVWRESPTVPSASGYSAILRSPSRCFLMRTFIAFFKARSFSQCPPLNPLRAVRSLPSSLRGPVDFSHGRHVRISVACRARRSGVQPLAIARFQ